MIGAGKNGLPGKYERWLSSASSGSVGLFRYRFKLGKLAKYPWNSECLAFSEVQVFRCMSWRTRGVGVFGVLQPPTRKYPRLAGLPPFVPTTTSPRSMLRPNKLLVQAIAAVKGEPSPKASAQATVETPSVDIKGKKAARISVKPLKKGFSQRIIASGGPSRPKPKKVVIIDLVSDEEGEVQGKKVATQAEEKEEEEDPEEYPPPYSPLPPFPPSPELGPGEYDNPHYWDYDGDLDQWGTDVVGGEPAAAHDWDSTEETEEDCSTSSNSTN
ncbi:hypothetical protein PIB30_054305 [Stylosanthes scabra]|uniref:Uncharacterized protein n=1 Tax=Stylosanthes scabra TaxID=79078 RepID=A0ABU6ZHH5_9FABA|nr:hypothetical protein [Stylosanthes scabra]